MSNFLLGIDTWEGQLSIDESVLLANDVAFMFIRLNDINGSHHKDELFDIQWSEAKAFCRAPYFVYSPWYSGSGNFQWLQSHMPADAKAVAIDIEVRMSGYEPSTYGAEVKKFLDLVRPKWNHVIYTGEWFLPFLTPWPTNSPYWWAQYPYEFYPPDVVRWTWGEIRQRLSKYSGPSNSSKCPGPITFWQFSGDKIIAPGNPRVMDINAYFGTRAQLETFMGAPGTPQPPADTITQPHDGMTRISGIRHGWKFELFVTDPSQVNYESVCLSPLETPSSVARRKGATLAINGGEWDRVSDTKDYTVDDGFICHTRISAVPSLMILGDGTPFINHTATANVKHALSGLRYLIQAGAIKTYLYGTEPQYTEGHARSIHGINNNGHHMVLQSTGVYPNQGLTLLQAAEIMRSYGAFIAFDSGGGGDVACILDGVSLIVPENVANGIHFERPLPNVFLVYAGEKPMPETFDLYEYTATGNRAIRVSWGVNSGRIASNSDFLNGKKARGKATPEDRHVLTSAELPQTGGMVGDVWVKLYDNNGVPVNGWTAKTHMGQPQVTEVFVPANPDPEPEPTGDIKLDATLHADGTITGSWTDI